MTRTVTLSDGTVLPALGMGTWNMGGIQGEQMDRERESLGYGLKAGLSVVDTAEMYGHGRSESLVGEVLHYNKADRFVVTKVLPENASFERMEAACTTSLRRLGLRCVDLYLLHWRGTVPLRETVEAFRRLREKGLIKRWGVSNFDVDDLMELERYIRPGECAVNQILYNLEHRGVEYDLLDAGRFRNIVTMAYSPLGQGMALLQHPALQKIAARHTTSAGPATPAQIALAWALRQRNILAIPKASSLAHLKANIAAQEINLTQDDLAELDAAFPPPVRKMPLDMI